jgi:hypothetical protein
MGEFFVHKITSLRAKLTEGDLPDVGGDERTDVSNADITFSEFAPLPEEDIRKLALANRKSCVLYPIPSAILSLDELLLVLTKMVNFSLETGHFANDWKCALVHPLLKKCNLEIINKNFHSVGNMQFASKLTEKSSSYSNPMSYGK